MKESRQFETLPKSYRPDPRSNKPKRTKSFSDFKTENVEVERSIQDYLKQIDTAEWEELPDWLYQSISEEGWVGELETEWYDDLTQEDFEYMTLDLTDKDELGLIKSDSNVLEKLNEFDIALKAKGEWPFDTLDFIDYTKGIVYIIRVI